MQYTSWMLLVLLIVVCFAGSIHYKSARKEGFATGESQSTKNNVKKDNNRVPTSVATPWACHQIQNWGPTNYTDAYVVARKTADSMPQCWKIDESKTEHTNTCSIYNDKDECKLALMTSEKTPISSCSKDVCHKNRHTCNHLSKTVWQCHLVDKNKNVYHALRKNEDKNIECLGHSRDTCIPFTSLMSCMETIPMIQNTKHMACGRMMYELTGTDGYSDPDHYCAKFKDVVS